MLIMSQNKGSLVWLSGNCKLEIVHEKSYEIYLDSAWHLGSYDSYEMAQSILNDIFHNVVSGAGAYQMPENVEVIKSQLYNISLESLFARKELSAYSCNILRRNGYENLGEVSELSKKDLANMKGVGAATICEIKQVLEKYANGAIW